jgi:hypothetical protein
MSNKHANIGFRRSEETNIIHSQNSVRWHDICCPLANNQASFKWGQGLTLDIFIFELSYSLNALFDLLAIRFGMDQALDSPSFIEKIRC